MYARQVLQRRMPEESLAETQEGMQTTSRRATRRGPVQGPSGQGGLSHLLLANAVKFGMLHVTSRRDYRVRTNL